MSDFLQDNHVTTFHSLGNMMTLQKMEADLRNFTPGRPVALLVPALFSELEGNALPLIIEELKSADYIKRIIVSLDRANKEEFTYAKAFFKQLPQDLKIMWNDGPRMKSIQRLIEKHDIPIGPRGKGRVVIAVADDIDARAVVDVCLVVICHSNYLHHSTCTFHICFYKQNTSYLQTLSKLSLKGSCQESCGQSCLRIIVH